jgi:hypothetical protein
MVPKHADGRFSHANLFWETSMSLEKKFFRGRSQLAHVTRHTVVPPDAAPAGQLLPLRLPLKDGKIGTGEAAGRCDGVDRSEPASSREAPRRTISAAGFELIGKAALQCAACADLALVNLPIAIMSWLLTQFFAGCAAYAEAMYPSIAYAREGDDADRHQPLQSGEPERGHSGQSPALAPELSELSRFAIEDGKRHPGQPLTGRTQSIAANSGGANIVRLNVTRRAPSGRLVSITLIVAAWLSRRRRSGGLPRGSREVPVELGNYDRRVLRRIGVPRYGTE